MKIKQIENSGSHAVMMLRKTKLNSGLPFMINTNTLPTDQCYLEFPNGDIKWVTINKKENDFSIVGELTSKEINALRKKYKLN